MEYLTSKGNKNYSFAEYIVLEEASVGKNDFYHGGLFAMEDGTKNHNNIVLNVGVSLRVNKKPGCDVFIDGMKLEIEKEQFYVYPDLIYTCNDDLKGTGLLVKNPSIIVEVLSDSSSLRDRNIKHKYYLRNKSLKYYVLISQKEIYVECYSRIENSPIWKYQTFETIDELIEFDRLGFALSLATIYDSIEFEEA